MPASTFSVARQPVAPAIFMLAKAKADADKPKRPLSAYFRFTIEKRKELKVSMPTLSNTDVVKKMGEMWKALTPAEKKPYEEAAAAERAEYDAKYGKAAKKSTGPKKPLSAYMLYSNAVREEVKSANPTAKFGDIAKIIGASWREMQPGEKQKWVDKEQENKKKAADEWLQVDSAASGGTVGEVSEYIGSSLV
eukprot:CAMPEP_0181311500 /NCGR_PEP_ID=MMETSP1101-20121128/13170_1 /TAXON_ID=46948 /ORGANISM="Rhodomonas abbreviata, Strain Caron Lab Isolate" /LENGTH=192 /DNA_ID=CAMNT_0023418235 /DNA_START=186 /DNA_END=765 /DNA_ORIENTATION=+